MKEAKIQTAIMKYLDGQNYDYFRQYVGGIPTGSGRGRKRNPMVGFPDLWGWFIYRNDINWAIEVKAQYGKLSDKQVQMRSRLIYHGWKWTIARSVEDAQDWLWEHERTFKRELK